MMMKKFLTYAALAAAFVSVSLPASAQEEEEVETPRKVKKEKAPAPVQKMFVAVNDFENKSSAPASAVNTLRDRITGLIVNTRKFDVVERAKIKELLKEQNLAAAGVTDAEDAPEQGRMKAAGYIFYGTVLSYGADTTETTMQGAGGSKSYEAKIELEVRLANAETGKILSYQTIMSSAKTRQYVLPGQKTVGNKSQQADRDALAAVARDAIFLLLDQAYPVKVLSVGDDDITINVNKDILAEGDVLNLYGKPKFEVDEDTGEKIPVDGKQVGRVIVTETGERTCKVEPIDWVKVRGTKRTKQKACDLEDVEKGMILHKVNKARFLSDAIQRPPFEDHFGRF